MQKMAKISCIKATKVIKFCLRIIVQEGRSLVEESQWKTKIRLIADKEEKIIQQLLNYNPQPHLTEVMDHCSLCYKKNTPDRDSDR